MTLAAPALLFCLAQAATPAGAIHGRVVFNGTAVPGAVVSVTRDAATRATTTDDDGAFEFAELTGGTWALRVELRGFVPAARDVIVPQTGQPLAIVLSMRSLAELIDRRPSGQVLQGPPPAAVPETAPADTPAIVNGSVMNGAVTRFAQPRAFGNNRPKGPSLYNRAVTAQFGDSSWNARPYTFGASNAPGPDFTNAQAGFTIGGPLKIPWLLKYGPQTFLSYQHGVTHVAETHTGLMPTEAQRAGDFSGSPFGLRDPASGLAFPGDVLPTDRITSQARALLALFPLPNGPTSSAGNYEVPALTATTQDAVQLSMGGNIRRASSWSSALTFRHTGSNASNLFGFVDRSGQSSFSLNGSWGHRFSSRFSVRLRYQFTRDTARVTPFFAGRVNVSGEAGVTGNSARAADWGPPSLLFPDITDLTDASPQRSVKKAHQPGAELVLRRGMHTMTAGGDVKLNALSVFTQPDPRGTLTFTGELTGVAFADFLLGAPAASAIAFGDEPTRLRAFSYDLYMSDDWRPFASLTLTLGVRWEYDAPFTERRDRLANLVPSANFETATVVLADRKNRSLIEADKRGVQPRLGLSWRPSLSSPVVVRAGYGLYRNLDGYEWLALLLAQQPPLSKTFSVRNGPGTPLTLARPFPDSFPSATNTVGIDPSLRAGSAQSWQVSVQRELPGSLTATAAYMGTAGRHLPQAFLPNTYAAGAVSSCPACATGFVYITSGATSLRNAAQFTLRRRLHNGLTGLVQYTLASATDDAATFSNRGVTVRSLTIAQDWLDLRAERGPSTFDQRHLVTADWQYTSGVKSVLWRDWTLSAQMTFGSGLPFTPVSFVAVAGTGVVGTRPSLTGAPIQSTISGRYANPSAFVLPAPGTWGNAGRNSLRGPAMFGLDGAIARAIPLRGRINLEWRLSAMNLLNRVTFTAVNAVITSPQFGLPTRANPMRSLQAGLRLRF